MKLSPDDSLNQMSKFLFIFTTFANKTTYFLWIFGNASLKIDLNQL
jgi:hypothetical protein